MYLVFYVDAACVVAAPASDDVILMCESAKVSGTVTSHASALPFDHGIKSGFIWAFTTMCDESCWFLVCRNLCPFDCPPDDVI